MKPAAFTGFTGHNPADRYPGMLSGLLKDSLSSPHYGCVD